MKVGIAIPCHNRDRRILKQCQASIESLYVKPFAVEIYLNNGEEGLKTIITKLFDRLFAQGCDVVLKASADFYLSPSILGYVNSKSVVTFTPFSEKAFDLFFGLHRIFLHRRTWSGCYSIPKSIWLAVKDQFDGDDTSIMKAIDKWKVKSFQYRLLRPYQEETTRKKLCTLPLWKRLIWQMVRMKAVRLRDKN